MTLRNLTKAVFPIFLLCLFICSCAKKAEQMPEVGISTEQVGGEEAPSGGEIKEGVIGSEGIREPGSISAISEGRTSTPFLPIYFDFDRYAIRPDMRDRMEYNAKVLQDNRDIKVEIQGNCDERGTNEYNLALGEKRANAAKDYLVMLGVSPDRISVVSLGEEKPLELGHNESAWAKNRRDDFVIYR